MERTTYKNGRNVHTTTNASAHGMVAMGRRRAQRRDARRDDVDAIVVIDEGKLHAPEQGWADPGHDRGPAGARGGGAVSPQPELQQSVGKGPE